MKQNTTLVWTRVIYARIWSRKNYFVIATFFKFWKRTSRSGNSNENRNTNKHISVARKCNITLNFPALDITCSNWRKGRYFQIIFPVPHPIIYNPDTSKEWYICLCLCFCFHLNFWILKFLIPNQKRPQLQNNISYSLP